MNYDRPAIRKGQVWHRRKGDVQLIVMKKLDGMIWQAVNPVTHDTHRMYAKDMWKYFYLIDN